MTTTEILNIVLGILSLAVGGGLFYRHIDKGKADAARDAVVDTSINNMKAEQDRHRDRLDALGTRHALVEQQVGTMSRKLDKLDLLEVIHTNVENLKQTTANMMSRPEAEARISGLDHRVEVMEAVVLHSKDDE